MFFSNNYKYLYLIVSFCNDGFYVADKSKFDSINSPFFYKCRVNTFLSPSKDYRIYIHDNQLFLGLKHQIDFTKPYLYQ